MEDLNPLGQTDEQPGVGYNAEASRTDAVLDSSGASRVAKDPTTITNGSRGGEQPTTTMDESVEMPGATDAMLESRAQKPMTLVERSAHPETSQGAVSCPVCPPIPQGAPPPFEEEDVVEKIHHEEVRPQPIRMFHKRGEEVMVVEEEDTTKEVKRLWSTLSMDMKQIEVSVASVVNVFGAENYYSL